MNQKMSQYYKHREKKPVKNIAGLKKYVRIDERTQMEVSASIPDDEARERYISRLNRPVKGAYASATPSTPNLPLKNEYKEVPVGDLDELELIIESVAPPNPSDQDE
jgi:hypothetical protein